VAQFDVYRLSDGVLVVDLQTDLIGLDATRIAAPLRAEGAYARFPGLTPTCARGSDPSPGCATS
jgi:toxin CcdB